MSISSDGRILVREVPDDLKKLLKMVVRGFHQHKEDAVVVDYLLRNTIMSETQLHDLLKLDRKMLRTILNRLRGDHYLKTRLRIEDDNEGKSVKQTYYYINYKGFVNVVKYKLHQMQKKIESQERDDSCKASYVCSNEMCSRSYSELDIDKLLDFSSNLEEGDVKMMCTFCGREVTERKLETDSSDTRQLLIKFNQQMEPIYDILRDIENYTLSHEILEPPVAGSTAEKEVISSNSPLTDVTDDSALTQPKSVTIDFGAKPVLVAQPKEVPAWMKDTTISSKASAADPQAFKTGTVAHPSELDEEKIKKTLMFHESKTLSNINVVDKKTAAAAANKNDSDDSDHDRADANEDSDSDSEEKRRLGIGGAQTSDAKIDEMMSSDGESDGSDSDEMVSVGGIMVPFSEITDQHIGRMTAAEKEAYLKLGQSQYSHID